MSGRKLFIFLEGNDDVRFFSAAITPLFAQRYERIDLVRYACLKCLKLSKYIRSLDKMGYEDILIADIDNEPGVRAKKELIIERYPEVQESRIIVIVREIESWYLAGLDGRASHLLGVRPLDHTDFVTKEQFNRWIPSRFGSRISFMVECLKYFSLPVAKEKNRSFRYFIDRFQLDEPDQAGRVHTGSAVQTAGR